MTNRKTPRQTKKLVHGLNPTEVNGIPGEFLKKKFKMFIGSQSTNKATELTHAMKIRFGSCQKIDDMSDRFRRADSNVESVDDWLSKIFFHCRTSQTTQINTMKTLLIPNKTSNKCY